MEVIERTEQMPNAHCDLESCALVLAGPIVAFFGTKTLLLGPVFQWGSHEAKTDVVSAVVAGL